MAADFPRLTVVDRTNLHGERVLEILSDDLLQLCYIEKHLPHESVPRCVVVPQREFKLLFFQTTQPEGDNVKFIIKQLRA